MGKSIKAFKAFNDDLSCRDHKYELGKSYQINGELKICRNGYHSCENPFDTLSYYPLVGSRFAEVTAYGDIDKDSDGSKIASTKITIDAELNLAQFISSCANWLINKVATTGYNAHSATTGYRAHSATTGYGAHSATTGESAHSATTGGWAHSATSGYRAHSATTGESAHSATTGYGAHSATSGYRAHSATTGYGAHSATTGESAHSATTGDRAHSATTGDRAHSATTGDRAHSATTGESAHSATTGDRAHSATTGESAHSATTGESAIACSLGNRGQVKASAGNIVIAVEYDDQGDPVAAVTGIAGENGVPADTWLYAENGRFVEVTNEQRD